MTSATMAGPVRNMVAASVMTTKSLSAGAGLLAQARRQDVRPDQAQRAGVAQRFEALERGELLARALDEGEGHDAPPRHSTALWPPKPNEFDSATGGRPLRMSSGRAALGT